MTPAVLAIDQGTTSTKAMLVDPSGAAVGFASVPVRRYYPRPGWVEQDPAELWSSVIRAAEQLPKTQISCVGVSSQRESVVIWDRRSGRPLTPCVSWQCNRGAQLCSHLNATGAGPIVRELTGLPLDPMFSASKLRHLLDADPALRRSADAGEVCAGTIDSWLAWNLSGRALHITDAGNASRTLLFDIHSMSWSHQLLEIFDLPEACLPEVVASAGILGETVSQGPLPSVALASLVADSHAALYGLGCLRPGTAKATYGTGTSVASPLGTRPGRSANGLATSVAWVRASPTFALEGNVFSSGATVEWVAKLLGLEDAAAVEQLALKVASTGGVQIVPAFAGLGAPHWHSEARGQISGLTFASGASEVARAAIESIAFQVSDLVTALESDTGRELEELHADGGATHNTFLMQLQADLLGCPVVRSSTPDASALGAAFLAGLATGLFDGEQQVESIGRRGQTVEPRMGEEHRNVLLAGWHQAVRRVIATDPRELAT